MKNKLVLFLSFVTLLVTGCANNSKSNISNSEDASNSGSSKDSSISLSEEGGSFNVKFYVNTQTFTSWDPRPSGYFVHAWGEQIRDTVEPVVFDTWGNKIMELVEENLYCVTYEIPTDTAITGVVFAFKQGDATKQTIDMDCRIQQNGSYAIQYDGSQWIEVQKDVWKMSASIVPYN